MIDKVREYVKQYHMIAEGDTVITGVSGGADSVCLLLVLQELQKEIQFSIRVVHIEHGIRGEESLLDASFVKELCEERKVAFVMYSFDVPEIARERGMSEEEAGRLLRYEVFEQEAERFSQAKIAVAHHQNDAAETMLHNLVRGSRIAGLGGIAPVRGKIIRPLLCAEREEIEAYLECEQQEYRMDATNFDTGYTRNYIRHKIIPGLQEINSAAVSHMAQTAEMLREVQEYFEMQAQEYRKNLVRKERGGIVIETAGMEALPVLLRNQILYQAVTAQAESKKDITGKHIESLWKLTHKQTGRQINLPYDLIARKEYDGLWVGIQAMGEKENRNFQIPLCDCREFSHHILPVLPETLEKQEFPKKKYTKWIDYDKIKDNLCIRTRRPGDYFCLEEGGSRKKLKQYFVDEKIPHEQRDKILLVADGSHIVWIVGYRMSAYFKITEQTKRILEIQYEKLPVCGTQEGQMGRNGGSNNE